MRLDDATLESLRTQVRELDDRIAEIREATGASSTPGIREFRRTRLVQLEESRLELDDRLRRLESAPCPSVEAHQIVAALRGATQSTQGAFGG